MILPKARKKSQNTRSQLVVQGVKQSASGAFFIVLVLLVFLGSFFGLPSCDTGYRSVLAKRDLTTVKCYY